MAPDGMSRPGCLEDSIILSFENRTISLDMSATVIQTISDDHLHTELAHSHIDRDTTHQLGHLSADKFTYGFLISAQTLFHSNENPALEYIAILAVPKLSSPPIIQRFPEQQHRLSLYSHFLSHALS